MTYAKTPEHLYTPKLIVLAWYALHHQLYITSRSRRLDTNFLYISLFFKFYLSNQYFKLISLQPSASLQLVLTFHTIIF
jgi:hypothetical protein